MGSLTNSSKAESSAWSKRLKEPSQELRVTGVDNEQNPTLEIALLMDCTSSMSSWIIKAKQTLNEIIDKVVEECKEEGNLAVRVCFVGYRDIKDTERFTVMPFTDKVNEVKKFIDKTNAEGGADTPEDLQGGLKLALLQDWTEEASKRVFLICDAPCHGKQYHDCDEDYPNGSPDGLNLEEMMKEFCKKEIEFQVIKLDHNCNKMIEVMKQCHQELETTDMTGMQSTQSYAFHEMPEMACAEKETGMYIPEQQMLEEQNFAGAASGMMMAEAAPRMMMAEQQEMMMPEQQMMNAASYEVQQQDYFQQEAISGLTSQVRRKQAAVRSKRSKMS